LPADESESVAVVPEFHVTPPVLAPPIVMLPDVPVVYVCPVLTTNGPLNVNAPPPLAVIFPFGVNVVVPEVIKLTPLFRVKLPEE